jgi:DNA-binding GntR family transcriptional regulator
VVHKNLLDRILQGNLPPGSRVKDTDLSQSLDVSRTPVREALVRLEKEGFMENQVGRGFIVRPLTAREVREIYPIIWSLETLALKTSEPLAGDAFDYLERITIELKDPQQDFMRLIELDKKWHNTLLSGCNNRRLTAMISDLKTTAFRYEYAYMQDRGLVETSIREHREIAEILAGEKPLAAAKLLEEHWESTMRALLKKIE